MKTGIPQKRFIFYLWLALAWLLLRVLVNLSHKPDPFWARMMNDLWRTAYLTVLNYFLFEYTIPFIKLRWKRILAGLFLIWLHIMMYSFGLYAWRSMGIAFNIYTPIPASAPIGSMLETQMGFSVASVFFFGIIKHIYGYIKLKQAAQQLRIEKQQAELNYLKSQTNPHFLFNTLNNIYSLARDKSDLAPESILRLSKILRFMLYEAGGEYIAIEDELKIISDYIALERLRYDESLHINFNHDIEDMKQALPPLLLIPLVENAFKHGASETTDRPFVDIHLSVKNRQLTYIVKNSTGTLNGQQDVKENIGLSNLRRQLQLLYTDYDLTFQRNEQAFTATLHINLASHV